MAARRTAPVVALIATSYLAVASSCTNLRSERFAVDQTADDSVRFIACAEALPAEATIWRTGPNNVVGDADDEIVWGPSSAWVTDEDGGTASLKTDTRWEVGLSVVIVADTGPTVELGDPPDTGALLDLGGGTVTREDFTDGCP